MPIPLGPQLIGQTEKALNALLDTILTRQDLTEPQWVTLRLTKQFDSAGTLADFVRDQTHRADASAILAELTQRGLIADDALTDQGRALVARISGEIAEIAGPVWADLDPDDTARSERVLNTVLERTRAVLAQLDRG